MTFLLNGSEGLDRIKCMEMALVHDLAESLVGDITPYCGVSKKDKEVLEMEAIHKICGLIEPRGDHILQLFYVSIFTARERERGRGKESVVMQPKYVVASADVPKIQNHTQSLFASCSQSSS